MTMPNALSIEDTATLFGIARATPPRILFRELAHFWDGIACVYDHQHKPEQAAEAIIARDGCEAIVSALSELAHVNEAESHALVAKLTASIEAAKARRNPVGA